MPENKECPCQAVRDLQKTVNEHDKQLSQGNTNFALIQKDLEYIKQQLTTVANNAEKEKSKSDEKKEKIGLTAISAIFSAIGQIAVAAIALYLGLK